MTILLLDIPALHLAYLGFYGNPWLATPGLDRLASQSVVFDRHFAAGPHDLATSRYCFPLRGKFDQSPPENQLSRRTELQFRFIGPPPRSSLKRGFAHVLEETLKIVKSASPSVIWAEFPSLAPPWRLPAEALAIHFVNEDGESCEPWADPPEQLPAREGHLDRLQRTYAGVISFVDGQLDSLIETLATCGALNEMQLVLTSGHGLPLGEHSWIGTRRAWQHEEQVHLPLLMRLPHGEAAGLRVGALTQPLDVLPTLLEHLRLPADSCHGKSLWPLIRQETAEIRPFACSGACVGESIEWSLRTLDGAFLLPMQIPANDPPRGPQLFVKPDDRWEVNNVAHHHPEQVEEFEKSLRDFAASHDATPRDSGEPGA